jgi:anthranilate synthase component 1
VGAVANVGSVQVTEYKTVQAFSHVNHIVSRVVGQLKPSLHPLDVLKCSLPAGTLSGAPKIRAMEIIDELESKRRGLYGGAIVLIDEAGNLTSSIAIRMTLIRNGRAEVQAGAGVVLDSEGEKEALETEHKARGILEAIALAEGGVR